MKSVFEAGLLVCPRCKSPLTSDASVLRCTRCGRDYPVIDGVPDFLGSEDRYWGEIPPGEMESAVRTARESGFKESVMQVASKHPDLSYYLQSPARIDWLFHCLSSQSTGRCLDVGSGWGILSFSLARYFDEVWSLESVRSRIGFQDAVKKHDGKDNLHIVRANTLNLPFADGYFDLVAANGVLEWIGLADPSRNPRELQLEFLKEVRRVLKPAGSLYIGIENRLGVQYLLGSVDHSGLRWTSVVPRRIADLAVRLLRRSERAHEAPEMQSGERWSSYHTYTYTGPGYEKLLREAGYRHSKLYWCLSYNNPLHAGRVKDPRSIAFFARHLKRNMGGERQTIIERFVLGLVPWLPDRLIGAMVPLFSPYFLIYAYPEKEGPSLESGVAALGSGGSFLRLSGRGSGSGKMNYFLLRDGHIESVVKFPRFGDGATTLEREEGLMGLYNEMAIEKRVVDGITTFTEPDLKAARCKFDNRADIEEALRWLVAFQQKTKKGVWTPAALEAEIGDLVSYIRHTATDTASDTKSRIEGDLELFLQQASKLQLEKVSEHGDFCTLNILKNRERIYVVDWEMYREEGNPLFDFCFFLMANVTEASLKKRGERDDFFRKTLYANLTGQGKYSRFVSELLSEYAAAKGFPPEMMFCGMTYMLSRCLRRCDPRFGDFSIEDHGASREMLEFWSKVTYQDSVFGALKG